MSSPSLTPKSSNSLETNLFHAKKSWHVYPCPLVILLKKVKNRRSSRMENALTRLLLNSFVC